jgi:microcystin-dependent protein
MTIMDYSKFLDTLAYDKYVDMSATSVALCLSALTLISARYNWQNNGDDLNDTEWDFIDESIALANGELMSFLVGMIMPNVMATTSVFKMLLCDGSVHNKTDYPLLYDAIDPTYIISGTQFRTPDLRNRVIVGAGDQYALDASGGVDSVVLGVDEMPNHTHGFTQYTFGIDIESVGVPDPTGVGNPRLPENTQPTGGGEAHENRQPYRAINWHIVAG